MKKIFLPFLLLALIGASCKKDKKTTTSCDFTNDTNNFFQIQAFSDNAFPGFCKQVIVFGVPIYAVSGVEDAKLLHAANIMAQYLDNDEDGTLDNAMVVNAMVQNQAFMVMWKSENDLSISPPSGRIGQDLGNDETYLVNGQNGQFDASLEEVFHIITHAGYAPTYPEVFGEKAGSEIADAMDLARGGHFQTIPAQYPSSAWYTYDDATCTYDCMITEYHYWALTTLLGAQDFTSRCNQISREWTLCTPTQLQDGDPAIHALLTDSKYAFPTVLPDGSYMR